MLAGLNPWLVAIGILEIAAAIHAAYHQNPKMAVINVLYALSSFVLSAVKG